MKVITVKSYLRDSKLPISILLGIGFCAIGVNKIDDYSIFVGFRTLFNFLLVFGGLPILGSTIMLLFSFINIFSNEIKSYNKICVSQWRKDFLHIGFVEKVIKDDDIIPIMKIPYFQLTGTYKTLPVQINSNQYYKVIEIHIPLNLAIDEDFKNYQEGFNKQYSSQNIQISQNKIVKTIKIADAVEDKIIWAAIHELQNIVNEDEYKEQKLLNYLRFDEA